MKFPLKFVVFLLLSFGPACAVDAANLDPELRAYYVDAKGDQDVRRNLQQQIAAMEAALPRDQSGEPSTQPQLAQAKLDLSLALACYKLYRMGDETRLECARRSADRALAIAKPESALSIWANAALVRIQTLGEDARKGDPEALRQALELVDRLSAEGLAEKLPEIWARTQATVGMLLSNRRGASDAELDRAIGSCKSALSAFSKQEFIQERLYTREALNNALWTKREHRLNQAAMESADPLQKLPVRLITGKEHRPLWAWLYLRFADSATDNNVYLQVEKLETEKRGLDPAASKKRWIDTNLALAEAYLATEVGSGEANRALARSAVEAAFAAMTPEHERLLWAKALGVLGVLDAIDSDYRGARQQRAQAGDELILAAKLVDPQANPTDWAVLKANLANVILNEDMKPETLQNALQIADSALKILHPDNPDELYTWTIAMRDVALYHQWRGWLATFDLKSIDEKETREQYSAAEKVLLELLPRLSGDVHLKERLVLLADKIQIESDESDWFAARQTAEDVLRTTDTLLQRTTVEEQTRETISSASAALSFSAFAAMRIGEYSQAEAFLERTRATTARQILASQAAKNAGLESALERLQTELLDLRAVNSPIADNRRQAIRSEIFRLRAGATPISPSEVKVPPQTAIVTMVTTRDGGGVLLRTSENYAAEAVPPRSYPVLLSQILSSLSPGRKSAWLWEDGTGIGKSANMLADYVSLLLSDVELPKGTHIVWLPPVELANVPIEAWQDQTTGKYLLDDYEVSTTPSLALWQAARNNFKQDARPTSVAGIFNPTGNLPFAGAEEAIIGNIAPNVDVLAVPAGIAPRDLLKAFDGHAVWHFATHHSFNWSTYLSSGIELGSQADHTPSRLTLEDLFYLARPATPNLVLLTICESGIAEVKLYPDEVLGMSTAFLQLGASGVISARWDVSDLATSLFIAQFYSNLYTKNMNAYASLRAAQLWLRDATREEIFSFVQDLQSRMKTDVAIEKIQKLVDAVIELPAGSKPYADPKYWAAFDYQGAWAP